MPRRNAALTRNEASPDSLGTPRVIVSAPGKQKTKTDRLDYLTWYEKGEEPTFTDREIEIAILIADGYTFRQIASKLFVSLETIKTHACKLRLKTGKRTAAGVVAYLLRKGLIE